MMGRAGRPQYDRHGYAVIMVHEPKKQFYKRFLYEPFPVESSLANQVGVMVSIERNMHPVQAFLSEGVNRDKHACCTSLL